MISEGDKGKGRERFNPAGCPRTRQPLTRADGGWNEATPFPLMGSFVLIPPPVAGGNHLQEPL